MDCLEYLEQQHREVEQLFKEIQATPAGGRYSLFEQVADALTIHAEIEEQIFYPSVKAKDTKGLLMESVEEHLEAKCLIADLLDADPTDGTFDRKFPQLVKAIQHHVHDEEHELFPMVRQNLDDATRDRIGDDMMTLADKLRQQDDVASMVYEEIGAPAQI